MLPEMPLRPFLRSLSVGLLLGVLAGPGTASAQTAFGKPLDELTPEEILRLVRTSYTLHDRDFDARLRKDFDFVPFKLSLKPNYLRFRFENPPHAIHLDTDQEELALREVLPGKNEPVPPERYGEAVRGTDVTYEDLAMRFLYWPNPAVEAHETVKTRQAWRLRLVNPDEKGPYGHVLVWIDKLSGGMIKMEGYSRGETPKLIKDFEVSHGKKMEDVWIADVIRVRSFGDGGKEGTTWLEILDLK
jgi:hypothetical protein